LDNAFAAGTVAAAFFAAHRAFAASEIRFRPAAVMPPLELFGAAFFAAALAGFVVVETAEDFAARFFFAQRFRCASAMRWRASSLIARFPACGALCGAAAVEVLAVLLEVCGADAEAFKDSKAAIA
jgi:hypothetical protein